MSHVNSLFFSCPEAAGVLKICSKLLCNFIEITLRHGCSPLNLLHILTHLFLIIPREGCFFMLLNKISGCKSIVKYEPQRFFVFFWITLLWPKAQEQPFTRFLENIEAVARRCSVKKEFLEISQNSLKNTCTLQKKFSCEFCEISKNTFLFRTPPVAASGNNNSETCLKIHRKQRCKGIVLNKVAA